MKIGFFITARLKSSRLKQKILLDLNGKSILQRVIDRCKATHGIDDIVLCTSVNPQDSILYEYSLRNNIKFWAGSENDVLNRLLSAAEYFKFDAFLSITADNPLFSIYISQLIFEMYRKNSFDFILTKGLPVGSYPYLLNVKSLKVANYMNADNNTEIWAPFVNRKDFFSIGELRIKNSPLDETKRITCDYIEDYRLLKKIYSYFHSDYNPSLFDVFNILSGNKELLEINDKCKQRQISEKKLKEINKQFDLKKKDGKAYAKRLSIPLKPNYKVIEVEI